MRGVPDNLVGFVSQVPADLVAATGEKASAQEARAGKLREAMERRMGYLLDPGLVRQRALVVPCLRRGDPHENEILLARLRSVQGYLQEARILAGEGESDDARSGTIEPVGGIEKAAQLRTELLQKEDRIRRLTRPMDE